MYVVTRQCQWPEGTKVVEISQGGIDYTNPGAYSAMWRGEFDEIQDPREAVETGIGIAKAWKKHLIEIGKPERIYIAIGYTGGNTSPFEGQSLTNKSLKQLRDLAERLYVKMPKCDQCGDLLPDDKHERYGSADFGEYNCCSSHCAELYYAPIEDECVEV